MRVRAQGILSYTARKGQSGTDCMKGSIMMHDVCIFWTVPGTEIIHRLQDCLGIERYITVNGEQYVSVNDEQYEQIKRYEKQYGTLQIRHKKLIRVKGKLVPEESIKYNART